MRDSVEYPQPEKKMVFPMFEISLLGLDSIGLSNAPSLKKCKFFSHGEVTILSLT